MRWAQIKGGQKLHLVFEIGTDSLSQPICGRKTSGYRMTINVPLAHACHNCLRVYDNDAALAKLRRRIADSLDPISLVT